MKPLYPFAFGINPATLAVDREVVTWARQIGLLSSDRQAEEVKRMRLNWFAGYLYPQAPEQWLSAVSRLFCMLFVLDDQLERQGKQQDIAQLELIARQTIGICKGTVPHSALDDVFVRAFGDFWNSWPGSMDVPAFVKQLDLFWEGLLWEAGNRTREQLPAIEEYKRYRPYFSGAYLAVYLLRDLIRLPEQDCWMEYLEERAVQLICIANDLGSFEKEWQSGEVHNEAVLLVKIHKMDRSRALQLTSDRHKRLLKEFLMLAEQQGVSRVYVEALQTMVAGCEAWSVSGTDRYNGQSVI